MKKERQSNLVDRFDTNLPHVWFPYLIWHPVWLVLWSVHLFSPPLEDVNLHRAAFTQHYLCWIVLGATNPIRSLERCLTRLFSGKHAVFITTPVSEYKVSCFLHNIHLANIHLALRFDPAHVIMNIYRILM